MYDSLLVVYMHRLPYGLREMQKEAGPSLAPWHRMHVSAIAAEVYFGLCLVCCGVVFRSRSFVPISQLCVLMCLLRPLGGVRLSMALH